MKDPNSIDWDTPLAFDPENPGFWALAELQRLMRGDCERIFIELIKATALLTGHLHEHHDISTMDIVALVDKAQREFEAGRDAPETPTETQDWDSIFTSTEEDN